MVSEVLYLECTTVKGDPTAEQEKLPVSSLCESPQRKAVREMLEFVEKNHLRLEGVTVKELIHEDHRQP
jgi:hypothetical protein